MAPKVNLTKRVRIGEELRYCPVVEAANGRARLHVVWVDGRGEKHLEGAYYIEWRENAKRVWLSVGNDPAEAWAQRKKRRLSWTLSRTACLSPVRTVQPTGSCSLWLSQIPGGSELARSPERLWDTPPRSTTSPRAATG